MDNGKEMVVVDKPAAALSVPQVRDQVNQIQLLMKDCMKQNEHYGVVPGTNKPTLLKAGAEKLCLMFRLAPEYDTTEKYDDDHLTVITRCRLIHSPTGNLMGTGMGSCSTKESKYAYRKAGKKCPKCQAEAIIKGKEEYGGGWVCFNRKGGCGAKFKDGDEVITSQREGRVANEDLADCYNTVLKMSNKRALVAAVLNVTAASDIFTQDLEENVEHAPAEPASKVQARAVQGDSASAAVESTEARPGKDGVTWYKVMDTDGASYVTKDKALYEAAEVIKGTGEVVTFRFHKSKQGTVMLDAIDNAVDAEEVPSGD